MEIGVGPGKRSERALQRIDRNSVRGFLINASLAVEIWMWLSNHWH
jgi:hypothetical protein